MRIAEYRMREEVRKAMNPASPYLRLAVLVVSILLLTPFTTHAEVALRVNGVFDPPTADPIRDELTDILTDTLINVLFESDGSDELLRLDLREVAEGIRTGINVVIESKGYSIGELTLDLDSDPPGVDFVVHPVGWTPDDPHVTTGVAVQLDESQFTGFWYERLGRLLNENNQQFEEEYGKYLKGLPLLVSDRDWILGLVIPALEVDDPAPSIFQGFSVTHSVDISQPDVIVTLHLEARMDTIELIRPRMYSHTLYNVILDRFRERVNAEAGIMVGMPRNLVEDSLDELSDYIRKAIEDDDLAQSLNAYANVVIVVMPIEPVVRVDANVESRDYDLHLETFVDFGNESSNSTEVQARFGFLAFRGLEAFVNFNIFTNDLTLETDVALGIRPTRGTFAAVGYDLERKALKYFVEQEFTTGFLLRGEIFEDDALNEFGLSYQVQQYMSVGMFTNGDNEVWVRGIFTL